MQGFFVDGSNRDLVLSCAFDAIGMFGGESDIAAFPCSDLYSYFTVRRFYLYVSALKDRSIRKMFPDSKCGCLCEYYLDQFVPVAGFT